MHTSSYILMNDFEAKYLTEPQSVCDIGSLDVNGNYRAIFHRHKYTGLDLCAGKNVDVVGEPYSYPFPDGHFDSVVSGSTLEHVEDMHAWIKEVGRITKPGGLICVLTMWRFIEHRFPVDCWRILPDGMRFLFKIGGIEVIKAEKYDNGDSIGIGRKL